MFEREKILETLKKAALTDKSYEDFGSSEHMYCLGPALPEETIRGIERTYGFELPEEYFRFITQIGDGGACVDYGIYPFSKYAEWADEELMRCRVKYLKSLARPFSPRRMLPDEVDRFGFNKLAYENAPEKFFVIDTSDEEDDILETDGFLILGTHGCQWDYGIAVSGEYRGKIFDFDNVGGFMLVADSFEEYYLNWLDSIEENALAQRLAERREKMKKLKKCFKRMDKEKSATMKSEKGFLKRIFRK